MASSATAAAGWYADPGGQHEYRYWDGVSWTRQVADHGQSTVEYVEPQREGDAARVAALVDEAVSIIEANVTLGVGGTSMILGGSESPVMDGANRLGEAVDLRPHDPGLRYAWASALATAAQWKEARTRMEELRADHPNFLPARFAVEGWEHWTPLFLLSPWTRTTIDPHPFLREFIKGRILFATRDRIEPRATFFMRDVNGDLDASAVGRARIDVATVLSGVSTSPQVVAFYLRIWDDPTSPYRVESVAVPFTARASTARSAWEYVCGQRDLDLVILAPDDRVLLNRRVLIPEGMQATHDKLLAALLADDGADIEPDVARAAGQRHSSMYDMDGVPFEKTVNA